MRSTSRISVILLFVITFASFAQAQQTRVAYIDAKKLLDRMPEAKDAKARLDQLSSTWQKEAVDMQNDIDRKQAEFDRRKLIMTDAERNTGELELTNLNKKHTDFIHAKFDGSGGELFSQEAALMKPAYDKLSAAIKDCATDGNYDYVIDRSAKDVVLLYTNSKFDLTLPVARKLGIESEILSTSLVKSDKPGTGANGQPPTPGQTQPSTPGQPGIGKPGTVGQNPGANGFMPNANNGFMPNGGTTPPGSPGVNPMAPDTSQQKPAGIGH